MTPPNIRNICAAWIPKEGREYTASVMEEHYYLLSPIYHRVGSGLDLLLGIAAQSINQRTAGAFDIFFGLKLLVELLTGDDSVKQLRAEFPVILNPSDFEGNFEALVTYARKLEGRMERNRLINALGGEHFRVIEMAFKFHPSSH